MLTLFIVLIVFPCCDPFADCGDPTEYPVLARLSQIKNGKTADTLVSGVSLYVVDPSLGSRILLDNKTVSLLSLPPDPLSVSSLFIFSTDTLSDSIMLYYRVMTDLVSYDCGLAHIFILDSVKCTGQMIDSVELVIPQTNTELNSDEENIRIYF